MGLNEPEVFDRLKHYNLKIDYLKVSAALLSALPLYVHLTLFIITLDSDNEITFNDSLEVDRTHTLTVTLFPANHCPGSLMSLLVSEEKSVLFTGGKLVIRRQSIIFSKNYKKLLFIILITIT